MQFVKPLLAVSLLALSATPVFADDLRMERRAEKQERRIQEGEDSGQLTNRETNRLEKRQDKIDNRIDRAESDGVIKPGEKRRIERAQDKQSKRIYNQKHDDQHQ